MQEENVLREFFEMNSSSTQIQLLLDCLTHPRAFWPCTAAAIGRLCNGAEWPLTYLDEIPTRLEETSGAYLLKSCQSQQSSMHCKGVAYGGCSFGYGGIEGRKSDHGKILSMDLKSILQKWNARHDGLTGVLFVHAQMKALGAPWSLQ